MTRARPQSVPAPTDTKKMSVVEDQQPDVEMLEADLQRWDDDGGAPVSDEAFTRASDPAGRRVA